MEGVKVVSIDDLSGLMLKFYNKLYGLRQEIAISPEASNLQELIGVMSGGVPQYQMTNQLAILVAQFDKFQAGFGLILQGLEKQGRLMNALTKAIMRDRDEKKP